jgi:hypothetical protein
LLNQLGSIGLFLHDSLHTEETMRFELTSAWSRLCDGGVIVADDIGTNWAFSRLAKETGATTVVGERTRGGDFFGVAASSVARYCARS